jgi:hypothetical protein
MAKRFERIDRNLEWLRLKDLIDAIEESERAEIKASTAAKADDYVARVKSAYASDGAVVGDAASASEAAAGMYVKDAGKVFTRRKLVQGSKITVQLIGNSAPYAQTIIEFGTKGSPPMNTLRRTAVAMGGFIARGMKRV